MSRSVVARAVGDAQYEWVRGDGAAVAVTERGDAGALAAAAREAPLALLFDGREVRLTEASIPAKARRQAALAAPFAVEDDVAEDLEELHVVCGEPLGEGRRVVAVARLQTLRELLVPLNSAGVSVARIVPDCLALPFAPGRWSLLGEDGRVLVRCGTQLGFAVESELLDPLLARLDPAGYPAALDLYGDVPVPDAFAAVPRTRHPLPQGNLVCLAGGATLGSALDLMPDSFRPLRKRRGVWLGAALLVAALAAHLGMLWRDNAHLAAAVSAVRAEQQKVMQAAFPAITRVVNAELQATQAVAELREQAGNGPAALEMLHAAGRLMQSEGSGKFTLESVNYADGVLNLRLRGADVESIERYSAALKSTLAVEVVAVESQPDGTVASLRLQAPQKSAP